MPRPSNQTVNAEVAEAIDAEVHALWLRLTDEWREAYAIVRDKPTDRKMLIKFAVREVLLERLTDELNDRTSDIVPNVTDVREKMR